MGARTLDLDVFLEKAAFQLKVQKRLCMDGIWGIMGPSGCGKTSLLRCIAGLEPDTKGTIKLGDNLWLSSEQRIWTPPEKRNIGYIFQDARLFPHLTVMGNLSFAIKRRRPDAVVPDFTDVVEQLGIEHLLGRSVGKLSGGEKQRIAIARTLLNGASILLMDEPLAALDWSSKLLILPLLRRIYRHFHIPVIVVSHAPDEMARLVDYLLLIDGGTIISKGRCRAVLQDMKSPSNFSVLEGTVIRQDKTYSLTEVDVGGQRLWVNRMDAAEGHHIRLVLSANEVSVFLDNAGVTSIQNRLNVVVEKAQVQKEDHVLLTLSAGDQKLLSLITRKSMAELSLTIGQQVYAYFKTAGVDTV